MSNYDEIWTCMNDLEEAFNKVSTIDFLSEQIEQAVNFGDTDTINDAVHALRAFLPMYQKNFDQKFTKAWDKVVVPLHKDSKIDTKYQDVVKYFKYPEVSP